MTTNEELIAQIYQQYGIVLPMSNIQAAQQTQKTPEQIVTEYYQQTGIPLPLPAKPPSVYKADIQRAQQIQQAQKPSVPYYVAIPELSGRETKPAIQREKLPSSLKLEKIDEQLKPYIVRTPAPLKGAGRIEGYDIVRYLRDGGDPEHLEKQGFRKEDIESAINFIKLPFIRPTAQDKIAKAFVEAGGSLLGLNTPEELERILREHPELEKMQAIEAREHGLKPDMSLDNFKKAFTQYRMNSPTYMSIKDAKAREAYLNNMATREYMRLYGRGTALGSRATEVVSFVFSPVRALQPDVEFKDISGAEWAIGAGQTALVILTLGAGSMLSAGIPRAVVKGLEIGATGTMASFGTYETAKHWGDMTPAQRTLAVVIDTALIAATGKAMLDMGKIIKGPQKYTAKTYIDDLVKSAEPEAVGELPERFIIDTTRISDKTANTLASYREMVLDQAEYARGIKRQVEIEKQIQAKNQALRDIEISNYNPRVAQIYKQNIKAKIRVLEDKLDDIKVYNETAKVQLEQSVKVYREELKDAFARELAGADEPITDVMARNKLKETLEDMPRNIPHQTESVVRELMESNNLKQRIASLESEVSELQAELRRMREKYPTNPAAYSDITAELAAKEAQLAVLKLGDVKALQSRLIALRDKIDDLNRLKKTKGLTQEQRIKIQKDLIAAEQQAVEIEAQLRKALQQADEIVSVKAEYDPKTGNIIYKPLEPMGKRIGTKIDIRTGKPIRGGGTSPKISMKPAIEGAIVTTVKGKRISEVSKEMPAEIAIPETKPGEIVQPYIQPVVKPETETETKVETKARTGEEAYIKPEEVVRIEGEVKPEVRPETRAEVKPETKAETKVESKIKTSVKEKLRVKPKMPIPEIPPDEILKKKKRIPRGAYGVIASQHGIVWLTRWYPYRQEDAIWTRQKPKGAIAVADSRRAYDTIQTLTGMPPDKVPKFDMGIFDVYVSEPPREPIKSNVNAISFLRDPTKMKRSTSRKRPKTHELGAGVVEIRTKRGRKRHIKLT